MIPLTVASLLLSSVMVTLFGRSPADLQQLSVGALLGAGMLLLLRLIPAA